MKILKSNTDRPLQKLKQCLKDQRGVSFPLVIAIVLVLLMVMCGAAEFFRLNIIASGVKEAMQDAIIGTVNDNYANVYHGVREGYSGGYLATGEGFEYAVDTGDIYFQMDMILGTTEEGSAHVKYTEGVVEYRLSGLSVSARNAPLAPSDPRNAQRFEADAAIDLEVPVRFAGKVFPAMKVRLKVQAGYIEVF